MSLINQMLKDLEARRQSEGPDALSPQAVNPGPRRSRWPWMLAGGLLVVGCVALGLWLGGAPQQEPCALGVAEKPVRVAQPSRPAQPVAATQIPAAGSETAMVTVAAPAAQHEQPEALPAEAVSGEAVEPLSAPTAVAVAEPPAVLTPGAPSAPAAAVVKTPETAEQQRTRQRDRVQALIQSGQLQQARQLLQKLVVQWPADKALCLQLASLLIGTQDYAAALAVVDQGVAAMPAEIDLHVLQARLLAETGQPESARQRLLALALPGLDQHSDYQLLLAVLHQRLGDYPAAMTIYRRLCERQPQRGNWWLGLAVAQQQAGQRADAQRSYQQALACSDLKAELRHYARQQLEP
ncbi:MAG: tetratricopeptide repeat protein [Desulfuromonadaceae bacterium]|nr:tetratricopeptide repeat protein [Desulfuromonadaceae bacterium]